MGIEELIAQSHPVPLPPPAERKRRRKACGITLLALSGELDISEATMSRIENGVREPKGELRDLYAGALATMARYEGGGDAS